MNRVKGLAIRGHFLWRWVETGGSVLFYLACFVGLLFYANLRGQSVGRAQVRSRLHAAAMQLPQPHRGQMLLALDSLR